MGTGAEIHKQVLEHAILARRYRKKEKKNVWKFDIFYENKTIPQVTDLATKSTNILLCYTLRISKNSALDNTTNICGLLS